ncbi:hypothetical protein AO240_09535 [Pseudomonas sp. ICMP 460]|nr:hypothetical protein AO240_09535 [Pseudomonas sp. ICMP 460]
MSNFFLQVNRKKVSADGISINELSKWSSVEVRTLQFTENGLASEGEIVHAVRLEFDINTVDQVVVSDRVSVAGVLTDLEHRVFALTHNGAL